MNDNNQWMDELGGFMTEENILRGGKRSLMTEKIFFRDKQHHSKAQVELKRLESLSSRRQNFFHLGDFVAVLRWRWIDCDA